MFLIKVVKNIYYKYYLLQAVTTLSTVLITIHKDVMLFIKEIMQHSYESAAFFLIFILTHQGQQHLTNAGVRPKLPMSDFGRCNSRLYSIWHTEIVE